MKLRMLAVAMVCTLLSVMVSGTAEAQRGRGYYGGGQGNYGGRGNGYYGNRGNCAPRYAQHGYANYNRYNNCAPRYNRPVYYNRYNNCAPRYVRVRPSCPPPRYYNYGGGYSYGNGYYGGNGGVSVNVNTPGFSGSWSRW